MITVRELMEKLAECNPDSMVMCDLVAPDLVYNDVNEVFDDLDFGVQNVEKYEGSPSADDEEYEGVVYIKIVRE
jgi:hypothetical protein